MNDNIKGFIILVGMAAATASIIHYALVVHAEESEKRQKIRDLNEYMNVVIQTDYYKDLPYSQKKAFLDLVRDSLRSI